MLGRLLEWAAVLVAVGLAGWWVNGIPLVPLLGLLGVFAGVGVLVEWFAHRSD